MVPLHPNRLRQMLQSQPACQRPSLALSRCQLPHPRLGWRPLREPQQRMR